MQYFISHYNKESEITFPEDFIIYDTTLRDGEQTPGVCFSLSDKLEIARKLDQFKIHQIEAGFPIVSQRERESVKAIANKTLPSESIAELKVKVKYNNFLDVSKLTLLTVTLKVLPLFPPPVQSVIVTVGVPDN